MCHLVRQNVPNRNVVNAWRHVVGGLHGDYSGWRLRCKQRNICCSDHTYSVRKRNAEIGAEIPCVGTAEAIITDPLAKYVKGNAADSCHSIEADGACGSGICPRTTVTVYEEPSKAGDTMSNVTADPVRTRVPPRDGPDADVSLARSESGRPTQVMVGWLPKLQSGGPWNGAGLLGAPTTFHVLNWKKENTSVSGSIAELVEVRSSYPVMRSLAPCVGP
eukprot:1310348-Rhodomonas_salina.2